MNHITEARKKQKLSKTQLARQVGCSNAFISLLESRKKNASPRMAKRIGEVLSIPPHAVIYPDEPFITETELPDALTTGVM